jgi:hypothetical protein
LTRHTRIADDRALGTRDVVIRLAKILLEPDPFWIVLRQVGVEAVGVLAPKRTRTARYEGPVPCP